MGTEYYGYAPDNKRIYRKLAGSGGEQWTFYGAHGEKLGVWVYGSRFDVPTQTNVTDLHASASNVWFGGKLISDGNAVCSGSNCTQAAFQDRLGTNRASGARFYPYGDEITSTGNDREKFATYTRDSFSGLDYAQNRYYASSCGRFTSADPDGRSANPKRPNSWNRYTYAGDDPVNRNDPSGKIDCWSWYLYVTNELGWADTDATAYGNCADSASETGSSLDPCTVAPEALDGNLYGLSCDAAPPCYQAANSGGCGGSSAPAAEQGGSTGGGNSGAPVISITSSFGQLQTQATAALQSELANLTPNCDKVLPVGALTNTEGVEPLTFWNATTQGSTPASLLGGTNGGTIGSYFQNGQYAVILNGAGGITNQVVLGANFFSDSSGGQQGLTLLHELLHFTLQMGDQAIDAHFGINVGVAGYSAAFSNWLANDCNN